LGAYLGREPLAELREVRADLLDLVAQQVLVDREQLLELLRREVEASGVEVLGARDAADRALARLGLPVEPAEDPLEIGRASCRDRV